MRRRSRLRCRPSRKQQSDEARTARAAPVLSMRSDVGDVPAAERGEIVGAVALVARDARGEMATSTIAS